MLQNKMIKLIFLALFTLFISSIAKADTNIEISIDEEKIVLSNFSTLDSFTNYFLFEEKSLMGSKKDIIFIQKGQKKKYHLKINNLEKEIINQKIANLNPDALKNSCQWSAWDKDYENKNSDQFFLAVKCLKTPKKLYSFFQLEINKTNISQSKIKFIGSIVDDDNESILLTVHKNHLFVNNLTKGFDEDSIYYINLNKPEHIINIKKKYTKQLGTYRKKIKHWVDKNPCAYEKISTLPRGNNVSWRVNLETNFFCMKKEIFDSSKNSILSESCIKAICFKTNFQNNMLEKSHEESAIHRYSK